MTYGKKFLLIPKRIGGKWYWLRTVNVETETNLMSIGGELTIVKKVKYIVE